MQKGRIIPTWKYWLSYLMEVHIESAPSEINPHLYVSLRKGKIQLSTANAVYSYEDRYDNFRLLFEKIKIGERSFSSALILGLGLGSVPLLLSKNKVPLKHMTLVELDERVIYLAEKYMLSSINIPYTIICADAQHFVPLHSEKYDIILSDIFLDDLIPDYFLSLDYLESLKRLMHEESLLVVNTLASTKEDRKKAREYFEKVFTVAFPSAQWMHLWENYMLLNRII